MNTQQKKVKYLKEIRLSKAFREQEERVLIAGIKMVEELGKNSPCLILSKGFPLPPHLTYQELFLVEDSEMKTITGLNAPEGIAALIPLPLESNLASKKNLLILDRIQDPGNVGTLCRSAAALGFEGLIMIEGGADLFNDKTIRSAKGASFHLPFANMKEDECINFLKKEQFQIVVADLEGEDVRKNSLSKKPLALILGNESKGASSIFKQTAIKISIPMKSNINSLNVASAGAILMFCLLNEVLCE